MKLSSRCVVLFAVLVRGQRRHKLREARVRSVPLVAGRTFLISVISMYTFRFRCLPGQGEAFPLPTISAMTRRFGFLAVATGGNRSTIGDGAVLPTLRPTQQGN